jgi:hypothetical protein
MKEELILDLRRFGSLTGNELTTFEKVSYASIESFNDTVRRFSEPLADSIDWWAQPPASRNTYASSFFHSYCVIIYVDEILKVNLFKWTLVLTDSTGNKAAIEAILRKHHKSGIKVNVSRPALRALKDIWSIWCSPFLFLAIKILQIYNAKLSKLVCKSRNKFPTTPITLIDTFSTEGYVGEERWYGDLWSHTQKANLNNIYFCPTIVNVPIGKIWSHYNKLRSSSKNLLIREDYLNICDIFYSVLTEIRVRNLEIPSVIFRGVNLSGLIREEILVNSDKKTTYEALLSYRFFKNIKNKNIQINIAIDWFEGQILDKVWNFSVSKFYPEAKKFGYRPYFGNSFYLSIFPLEFEVKHFVSPSVMLVTGRGMEKSAKKYYQLLETRIIPALRSESIRNIASNNDKFKSFNFLVALPISPKISENLISQIIEIVKENSHLRKLTYLLRPHPMTPLKNIKLTAQISNFDNLYLSDNLFFFDDLKAAQVLVTEASSSCLEAIALGVPVILLLPNSSLAYNPIPEDIPASLYKIVRGPQELSKALFYYSSRTSLDDKIINSLATEVMDSYFEPIDIDRIIQVFSDG